MNIEKSVNKLFDTCGQDVTLQISIYEYHAKAFVQIMRYKNKMYVDLPMGEPGILDDGCYLYIGKPEYDFSNDWGTVRVFFGGYKHKVKRAHMLYVGNKPVCVWAVLYRTIRDGKYETVN